MGCGCSKVVTHTVRRDGATPLNTPVQATTHHRLAQAPVRWRLLCDDEAPVVFSNQAEAINTARERGCRLQAFRDADTAALLHA